MQPEIRGDLQRILAIRLDNIGDVVLLGPALRALKENFPAAQLTLLASPAGAQAASLLPWLDEVRVLRAVWQDASNALTQDPAREAALVEELRHAEYDAAFIFTSFSQTPWAPAYACYLAGIPVRVGQSREFGGSLLTHWVKPAEDGLHQAERNLHLLRDCGLGVSARGLEVAVPAPDAAAAADALRAAGLADRQYIVVAPGASCSARRYPAHRFAEAVRCLREESGLPVVCTGSAREQNVVAAVEGVADASFVGRLSVAGLAAVIERSALVICNNSAPLHLADAFGVPLVVLYSGTDIESQWAPRRSAAMILRRQTWCAPCYAFQCPYEMACLDIPPEEVVVAALDLLPGGAASRETVEVLR